MARSRVNLNLTKHSVGWLKERAKQLGISVNSLIQILVNREIEETKRPTIKYKPL